MMPGSAAIHDPLRKARQLVQAARFRDALTALAEAHHGDLAEWHLLSAMAHWRVGDFASSLASAEQALGRYHDAGDSDGELRAQNVRAAGCFALGKLNLAMEGFQRSAFLADERGDALMAARAENNAGNVHHFLGDNPRALTKYNKAAALFRGIGFFYGVAEAEHNRSVVLREEGHLRAAKQASDDALQAIDHLGGGRGLGWALGGRGETDAMLGDLELGEAQVRRSMVIATKHEDRLTVVDGERILASIARMTGNPDEAITRAKHAVAEAEQLGSPWMNAKTRAELARSLESAGRPDLARAAWQGVISDYESIGATDRARDVHNHLDPDTD